MLTPISVLIVEDSPADAKLMLAELRHSGFDPDWHRVDTESAFLARLNPAPDLILSDFSMPQFNGLVALKHLRERKLDIPFIFVSGTIGEDAGVQAMREGAADYIHKDRPARLGEAVKQALARWKLREEKLTAEQTVARLAAIVETSGEAIIAKTLEGVITSWNPAAEKLYGYSAPEMLGKPFSSIIPHGRRQSDAPEDHLDMIERLGNGESIEAFETVRVRKDGRRIEVLQSTSPIRDPNGDVIGASTISHDITRRKRTERLLKAEQAVTGILIESPNLEAAGPRVLQSIAECLRWEVAILWSVDREAHVLRRVYSWHSSWAKRAFIEALSRETVLQPGIGIAGRTWSTGEPVWEPGISVNNSPGEISATTRDGLRGGFGLPMRHGAQMVGVIEFYNPEIREPDDALLAALDSIASQISQFCDKRQTEAALHASEEQFRNLVMALPAAVYTTDPTGLITLFNESAAELWGRRPEIGKDRWDGAWRLFRKDGTPVSLDQSPLAETLRGGSNLSGEELVLERPNGSRAHVLKQPKLLRGAAGEIVGAVNMVIDLTQIKQLETQFWQAQKMEAVGRLAGGVAHDFNNLLTVIGGYGDILKRRSQPNDPALPMLTQIVLAGARATMLTRQLLTFSHRHIQEVQHLDLNVIIRESETMLARLIGENIHIETRLAGSLRNLLADPGHMNQILMNLAVNARDAMLDGGRLLIETTNVDLDLPDAASPGATHPRPFVMLTITDTGCGMDEATRLRIFEPFFTTKGPDKGTGLGLSTVYGIVHMCGGHIEVESEVGRGTTFRIYLPEGQRASQPKTPSTRKILCAGGAETVLLVEDDPAVRQLARLLLADRGYKVLEADNGAAALALAAGRTEPIHLLLTDVIMPKMSGAVLADRLKHIHPETVILFMSGYTGEALAHHRVKEPGTFFLQKPFTLESLADKVRAALDLSAVIPLPKVAS